VKKNNDAVANPRIAEQIMVQFNAMLFVSRMEKENELKTLDPSG